MKHKLKYEDEHRRDRDICPSCGTSSGQENLEQDFDEVNIIIQTVECDCGCRWRDSYKLEETYIKRNKCSVRKQQ